MESSDPKKKHTKIPSIMAKINPVSGGTSEAFVILKFKGNTTKKTTNQKAASLLKFCLNPHQPSDGFDFVFLIFTECYLLFIYQSTSCYHAKQKQPMFVILFAKMNKIYRISYFIFI